LNDAVSSRYAAALADVAVEQKTGDRIKNDLNSFATAFSESADLRNAIESPALDRDLKHRIIEKIAERMDLAPAVRNFFYLLVDHGRTELLPEIRVAFDTELNARLGVAEAQIVSARPLRAEEKEQLTRALEKKTGRKIEARFSEDPSLVGGALVRVGSTVYDGSVREQLTRMREQLEEA
jgi:F-type H+-transporting ATPase subunit delta